MTSFNLDHQQVLRLQRSTKEISIASELLYLQQLGEERDNANHNKEQADAVDLLPLSHRILY